MAMAERMGLNFSCALTQSRGGKQWFTGAIPGPAAATGNSQGNIGRAVSQDVRFDPSYQQITPLQKADATIQANINFNSRFDDNFKKPELPAKYRQDPGAHRVMARNMLMKAEGVSEKLASDDLFTNPLTKFKIPKRNAVVEDPAGELPIDPQ